MQDYNTIIGAIQMRLNKCPTRSVMDRFRIGSSTLNLIMSRYKALELTIDELEAMSPKEVENLFYPQKNLQRKEVPLPDFQYYYDRIHAPNSRVNISFCWLDYKEKNPDGYEKSQFYEYYQRFVQENYGGTKISMAVNRKPGEKMYIDWVGDQPGLLTDVTTGEIMRVHIFATTLGVSSMIYAEAFPNEKLPCFIEGCVHAVSFYGAVAKHFVPDNLKTAVTKHTKDDLVLQSTFSDLEDFYDTIVLPPPARKPKGKPTVENHVRFLETHLIEKLKEKIYTSFEDLNADIKKIVAVLNARPFQNQAFSRQEMFIKYDKPCMKPLPGGEYTTCDYKAVLKVPNNYHIDYDGHYYESIYRQAKSSIYVVDNYIGLRTLVHLKNSPTGVNIILFSDNVGNNKLHNIEYTDFRKEYPTVKLSMKKTGGIFHDRFIVLDYGTADERVFLCGASSKDAGARITSIVEDYGIAKYNSVIVGLLKNSPLVLPK